jgi:cytoskeletal protein CcmA (bactofilin family)
MATFGKDSVSEQVDSKARGTVTVIAPETRFVGEVTGRRAVRVEGHLKGTVKLEAPLDVVEGASVEAEVHATVVRVAGNVVGNITATGLVDLAATAVVKGDILAPALRVVEGAKLEGRVQMHQENKHVKPPEAVQPLAQKP